MSPARFWDTRSAKITTSLPAKRLLYAVWTPDGNEVVVTTSSNVNMIVDVRKSAIAKNLPNSIEVGRSEPIAAWLALDDIGLQSHSCCTHACCRDVLLPAARESSHVKTCFLQREHVAAQLLRVVTMTHGMLPNPTPPALRALHGRP